MEIFETSYVTCAYKATRPELSKDPYAALWCTPQTDQWIHESITEVSPFEPFVHCLRNRFFVDKVRSFFGDSDNCTLINFGAGLSMYPYTLDPRWTYIELDQELLINHKKENITRWMNEEKLPQRDVISVICDFRTDSSQTIIDKIRPHIPQESKTFIIIEGVLYFLDPAITEKLFGVFASIQSVGDMTGTVSFLPESIGTEPFERLNAYFDKNNTNGDTFSYQTHSFSFYQNRPGYDLVHHDDYISLSLQYDKANVIKDRFSILNENMYLLKRNQISEANIEITLSKNEQDLQQIIDLQSENHKSILDPKTKELQGFVTVQHNLETLSLMASKHPHIIAKFNDKVVGYTLVMAKEFKSAVPELIPMFNLLDTVVYNGKPLGEVPYVVMGQVCVSEKVRGMKVFERLYRSMQHEMAPYYEVIVTEISAYNKRSIAAHAKVGFETIYSYPEPEIDEIWQVVCLPTSS